MIEQFTLILFKLPDNTFVLQRRTQDAPYGAGLLGIFGGFVEENESVDECLLREINEETNLDTLNLNTQYVCNFILPADEDYLRDRDFHLYTGNIDDLAFEVYEGVRAEAYRLEELSSRSDLTKSARYVVDKILPLQQSGI